MTFPESVPQVKENHRHIVFVDSLHAQRAPVNFGPQRPRQRPSTESLSTEQEAFARWVLERAGLSVSNYRQETLARRLPACLRLAGASSIRQAQSALKADTALLRSAIGALIIGVTGFFRDTPLFKALDERILPGLLREDRPLRIWSVGCSDGQELYSVSMLLAEKAWLHRAVLLGTDCRVDAVMRASEGVYDDREILGVPDFLRCRYFNRTQNGWRIDSRIRTVTQWRSANAVEVVEPGAWDLILCRNFVMYLEPDIASGIWERLHGCLRAGGVLIVGKAERPSIEGFYPLAPCVFRRSSRELA